MKITWDRFASVLGLEGKSRDFFAANWEDLTDKLGDEPSCPESFTPEFYEARRSGFTGKIGQDLWERIQRLLPLLAELPECWFYARAYEYMDYRIASPLPSGELTVNIPAFGEDTSVFYWMVKAGLIPVLLELYKKENIPLDMAESYLQTHIGGAGIHAKRNNGIPGCPALSLPSWDRQYVKKNLFRIGRLAYKPLENPWYLPYIYRHKTTGELAVFARSSWLLNEKSQMPYQREEEDGFQATPLREENGMITGYAIDPYGKCDLASPRSIPAAQWESLLDPSSLVGDIHIPAGEPFSPELILDSMNQAKAFLSSYFGREVAIFSCHSWLLNPAWEEMLPDSNIAGFQKEGYLFPGDCYDVEGLNFVFGRSDGDRLEYPRNTSLEKAFHQLFLAGEKLRTGGIFFLPEYLPFYGTAFYRNCKK